MTNPTRRRSSYKITFFDRHGAAGGHMLKAIGYGLMVFGCSITMFILIGVKQGLGFWATMALALVGSTTFGGVAAWIGLQGGSAAGDVAQYFTAGGSSTPYEDQFSQEQALIMKEDYAAAAACFEQRIATSPGDPRVLLAAADLYATYAKNPTRAAELYREVQRLPVTAPGQDVYASNKLADLYLGALEQPGRALVEFRRLINRYPNSRTADQARMALANLKPDLVKND